jgi:hypothetical protein
MINKRPFNFETDSPIAPIRGFLNAERAAGLSITLTSA